MKTTKPLTQQELIVIIDVVNTLRKLTPLKSIEDAVTFFWEKPHFAHLLIDNEEGE